MFSANKKSQPYLWLAQDNQRQINLFSSTADLASISQVTKDFRKIAHSVLFSKDAQPEHDQNRLQLLTNDIMSLHFKNISMVQLAEYLRRAKVPPKLAIIARIYLVLADAEQIIRQKCLQELFLLIQNESILIAALRIMLAENNKDTKEYYSARSEFLECANINDTTYPDECLFSLPDVWLLLSAKVKKNIAWRLIKKLSLGKRNLLENNQFILMLANTCLADQSQEIFSLLKHHFLNKKQAHLLPLFPRFSAELQNELINTALETYLTEGSSNCRDFFASERLYILAALWPYLTTPIADKVLKTLQKTYFGQWSAVELKLMLTIIQQLLKKLHDPYLAFLNEILLNKIPVRLSALVADLCSHFDDLDASSDITILLTELLPYIPNCEMRVGRILNKLIDELLTPEESEDDDELEVAALNSPINNQIMLQIIKLFSYLATGETIVSAGLCKNKIQKIMLVIEDPENSYSVADGMIAADLLIKLYESLTAQNRKNYLPIERVIGALLLLAGSKILSHETFAITKLMLRLLKIENNKTLFLAGFFDCLFAERALLNNLEVFYCVVLASEAKHLTVAMQEKLAEKIIAKEYLYLWNKLEKNSLNNARADHIDDAYAINLAVALLPVLGRCEKNKFKNLVLAASEKNFKLLQPSFLNTYTYWFSSTEAYNCAMIIMKNRKPAEYTDYFVALMPRLNQRQVALLHHTNQIQWNDCNMRLSHKFWSAERLVQIPRPAANSWPCINRNSLFAPVLADDSAKSQMRIESSIKP